MPKVRDTISISFACNMIDAIECLLLCDVNSAKNPDISYCSRNRKNLRTLPDSSTALFKSDASGFQQISWLFMAFRLNFLQRKFP